MAHTTRRRLKKRFKKMIPYLVALIASLVGGSIVALLVYKHVDAYIGFGWMMGIGSICLMVMLLGLVELSKACEVQKDKAWIGGRW